MNASEYVKHVMKTAAIGTPAEQRLHGCIGLVGEIGEIADALKRHLYYGTDLDIRNLEEEIGDVMWYAALLADSTSDISFNYQRCYVKGDIVPPVAQLAHWSGYMFFAVTSSKSVRQSDYYNMLVALGKLIHRIGYSWEQAATDNIAKLSKRYPKGTFDADDAVARKDKV
jgi:hypothetical protein